MRSYECGKSLTHSLPHSLTHTHTATAAAAAGLADPFGPEQTFSKEVDDKANAYFQAIYNRGMRVNRLLDMLKQFKDSPNKRDRVCVCSASLLLSIPPFFLRENLEYSL